MIQIENLSFQYRKSKPILENITTTLTSGKIYGLLGLNGEGKTTLLKLVAGLLFPTCGEVILDNKFLSTNRSQRRLAQLYMLPDQLYKTSLKIKEFVNIYRVFYTDFCITLFEEALADFHLHLDNKINALSFGQQKKIHLAFALATNTKFLLLDEPTNGLDIPSKAIFRKLLAKVIDDDKIIIISTHLINDIENLIDHLLVLKDNHLVFDNDINSILELYAFGHTQMLTENILYSEKSIANYKTIQVNSSNQETSIDIELLFNAIQNNKL